MYSKSRKEVSHDQTAADEISRGPYQTAPDAAKPAGFEADCASSGPLLTTEA